MIFLVDHLMYHVTFLALLHILRGNVRNKTSYFWVNFCGYVVLLVLIVPLDCEEQLFAAVEVANGGH